MAHTRPVQLARLFPFFLPCLQGGDPKEYSEKVKANYRLELSRDCETLVLQRVARVDKTTKQSEFRYLPVVPIEKLLDTVKEHYDGSMGINTLHSKV